ncbi:hypothetical protein [Paracoccus sediminilitoris]|uniref:hypothetical protein n=1 Tax=Paracoccus sediminilitoris TaxID=2202419 RepID=UPI00272B7F87|nr:hypothetical protein [Paracoccus sediminilitoris]
MADDEKGGMSGNEEGMRCRILPQMGFRFELKAEPFSSEMRQNRERGQNVGSNCKTLSERLAGRGR